MILLFNSDFDCLWSLPILELPRPFGVMGWFESCSVYCVVIVPSPSQHVFAEFRGAILVAGIV